MTEPLSIKKYPPSVASQLGNDSSVGGTTVKDALNTLLADIVAIGTSGVTTTDPTVVKDVPAWDSTSGHLRASSNVQIDSSNSDKLLFWASVGAFDTATDGATITFNFNFASNWQTTLGGNRQLAITSSTASFGQEVTIVLWQDATGNRTPVWFPNVYWDKGLAPIIDPTPGGWNAVKLLCIGSNAYGPLWLELCRSTSAPRRGIKTLTDGATVTLDPRVSPDMKVTLGGNRGAYRRVGYRMPESSDRRQYTEPFGGGV